MVDDAEFYSLVKRVSKLEQQVKRNYKTFISSGKDLIYNDQYLLKQVEELQSKVSKGAKTSKG
jgi:DNA polymerase III sliding clamp (beta) subunit (PCNA family)